MTSAWPSLITIITPIFNAAPYLDDYFTAICRQSYLSSSSPATVKISGCEHHVAKLLHRRGMIKLEVSVFNDNSTDDSMKKVEEWIPFLNQMGIQVVVSSSADNTPVVYPPVPFLPFASSSLSSSSSSVSSSSTPLDGCTPSFSSFNPDEYVASVLEATKGLVLPHRPRRRVGGKGEDEEGETELQEDAAVTSNTDEKKKKDTTEESDRRNDEGRDSRNKRHRPNPTATATEDGDDASHDITVAVNATVVASVASACVECIGSAQNLGRARNFCFRQSHGTYFCLQDADDVMIQDRLLLQLQEALDHGVDFEDEGQTEEGADVDTRKKEKKENMVTQTTNRSDETERSGDERKEEKAPQRPQTQRGEAREGRRSPTGYTAAAAKLVDHTGARIQNKRMVLFGGNFVRLPHDATPRYSLWLNNLTQDELLSSRFRDLTLIQPCWFFHRTVFDESGGYSEEGTGTPEDLCFFYNHIERGGALVKLARPLVVYRYSKSSYSWKVKRQTLLKVRVQHLERTLLRQPAWSGPGTSGFGIWGNGRDGKKFFNFLSQANKDMVNAFYDINPKKIGTWYVDVQSKDKRKIPIKDVSDFALPAFCCVALDSTEGELEQMIANLKLSHNEEKLFVHMT